MKRKVSLTLLLMFVLTLSLPQATIHASGYNAGLAQSYLSSHAQNPWSTMALKALGAGSIPSDYLKSVSSSSAIDYAAPILAITALGQNPRTFGSQDYVAKMKSFANAGQIGDASTLNDDVFGLLALISAGETSSEPTVSNTKQFILSHQQAGGGWGFATSGGSDSNITSAAIVALIASGLPASDSHIQNGFNYLKTAQNNDGGFTYDPTSTFGTGSDSSSTAWVIWALNAANINPSSWAKDGHSPQDYLAGQQNASGWFKYQDNTSEDAFSATTTAYSVIALEGKTLPLNSVGATPQVQKFSFRIEGSSDTVCVGQVAGPSALDIVKNAASQCGFTYHIKETSFGPYLDKINNDEASGAVGWIYRVNYNSPDVGAADYQLQAQDTVLWHFGDFNWLPSRINVSSESVSSGGSAAATVEFYNNNSWTPLEGATVHAGLANATTNGSGQASVSAPDGYYKVFAEKTGYIRSNSILVKFGEPASNSVNLNVNVDGQILGDSIAFTVAPGNLDFGTVAPGGSSEKSATITNTGTQSISVQTVLSGDPLFVDNLTADNTGWQNFKTNLNSKGTHNTSLKVSVPGNYSGGGNKNAQLTFWASPQ